MNTANHSAANPSALPDIIDLPPDNPLAKAARSEGIAQPDYLIQQFGPFFVEARRLIAESESIRVADATCVTEIKQSREARLAISKVRVAAEKRRKALKEDALRTGKSIDNVARVISTMTEQAEARLEEMEKTAERAEAARRAQFKQAREDMLRPYTTPELLAAMDLGVMPEAAFTTLYNQSKAAHEARVAEQARQAEERAQREAAEAAERERVRLENERLKREAHERERAAAAERARADAALRAERERAASERRAAEAKAAEERRALEEQAASERAERERLEQEAADRAAEEARRAQEAEAERRRAEAAPDVDKLLALATAVEEIPLPTMTTPAGQAALEQYRALIAKLAAAIRHGASRIGQ